MRSFDVDCELAVKIGGAFMAGVIVGAVLGGGIYVYGGETSIGMYRLNKWTGNVALCRFDECMD